MIGSVFQLEWRRACARGKHHRLRLVFWAVLAAEALLFVVLLYSRGFSAAPLAALEIAYSFFWILAAQHFALTILLPPVRAAGSIADEKMRGTLTLLLSTPLTPLEIIIGKWLGQVVQMILLALPLAPLLCVTAFMSGLPASWLVGGAFLTVGAIATLAAVGILASTLCRSTASAVVACYLVLGSIWVVQDAVGGVSLWHWEDHLGWDVLTAALPWVAVCGTLTVVALLLAAWRLRPAYERQLQARPTSRWWTKWLRRPAVSEYQPLRWKERFAGELGVLSFVRAIPANWRRIGVFVLTALCSLVTASVSESLFMTQTILFMVAISLIVAVRASGVITSERERQTWEALLSTPLTSYDMIRGKLWGIIDSARPYLTAYLVPAAAAACFLGPLAVVWTLYWWAATWILLYFVGAVGMQSSANSSGSWQSLLKTLATAGGMILQRWFFSVIPLLALTPFVLQILFGPFPIGTAIMSPAAFFGFLGITSLFFMVLFAKTEQVLQEAERRLEEERIPENRLLVIERFAQTGKWQESVRRSGVRA